MDCQVLKAASSIYVQHCNKYSLQWFKGNRLEKIYEIRSEPNYEKPFDFSILHRTTIWIIKKYDYNNTHTI